MYLVKNIYNRHRFLVELLLGLGFGYILAYFLVSLFVSPTSEGFIDSYAFGLFLMSLPYFYFGSTFVFHPPPRNPLQDSSIASNLHHPFVLEEKLEGGSVNERARNRINRASADYSFVLCGVIFIITAIILYRFF